MDYKNELNDLIKTVFQEGASDLHLAEGKRPTIRVSSMLLPLVKRETINKEMMSGFLSELITKEKQEIFFKEKELDFSYTFENGERFRGNAFFQQGRISVALRLIPKRIKSLEE